MLKFKRGFSLVELLVVIAIIGILAAVGITAYSGYTANAKVKASQAQHASILAVVIAEYAKCAGGSSTLEYVWGTDKCNATNPTESAMVTYFNDTMGMTNPYKTDDGATAESGKGAEGITGIACASGDCTIITNHSDDLTALSDVVKKY